MGLLEQLPEQAEAKRLLQAALDEGPVNAYLFHGPPGVGKRTAALAFAGELIGDAERVEHRLHPDLYVLEPLGDQIRIDAIRELRRDLHMRPFEALRRVYLVIAADLMNEDAADALLKDLEEPPEYAVLVLVATRPSKLPETIRSRCQLVPFKRLSRQAIEVRLASAGASLAPDTLATLSRLAGGRIDRAERLLDPAAAARRGELIELARAVCTDERFDAGAAARAVVDSARRAGEEAAKADAGAANLEGTAREQEQRARRIARGVEKEEILDSLDVLTGWYRDLLAVSVGAASVVQNTDRTDELAVDGAGIEPAGAQQALQALIDARRSFELNVGAPLAFEALFIRLRSALRAAPSPGVQR
jgi:DNA polymerase-3 subunit delta'